MMKYVVALVALQLLLTTAVVDAQGNGKKASPPPATPASPKPGGFGDPHFNGFDGSRYDFYGVKDTVFSILSEPDHEVNALFTELYSTNDSSGNFFTAFGISVKQHKIEVGVEAVSGALQVRVDGVSLTVTAEQNTKNWGDNAGVSVQLDMFRPEYGHAVEVKTPLLDIIIYSTPPHTATAVDGEIKSAYLNLLVDLLGYPKGDKMHGLLGRTYSPRKTGAHVIKSDTAMKSGASGQVDETHFPLLKVPVGLYKVSGLFGHDDAGNLFGRKESSTVRKLLQTYGQASSTFPLRASALKK